MDYDKLIRELEAISLSLDQILALATDIPRLARSIDRFARTDGSINVC